MPQENQVLRCFSCETFQVHIVKKAKKWECKICGATQSFKRHYGKGSGKDCRNHVMKLNELRFTKTHSTILTEDDAAEEVLPEFEQKKSISKWAQYLDEDTEDTESENESNFFKPENKSNKSKDHEAIISIRH